MHWIENPSYRLVLPVFYLKIDQWIEMKTCYALSEKCVCVGDDSDSYHILLDSLLALSKAQQSKAKTLCEKIWKMSAFF